MTLTLTEHRQSAGWAGGPDGCGVSCECGYTLSGFNTLAEASELLDQHIQDQAAQAGPRQALAAELHRLADAIAGSNLPLPANLISITACLESRADLEMWAAHLGAEVQRWDGNHIPHLKKVITPPGSAPGVEMRLQSPSEPPEPEEIEQLRRERDEARAALAAIQGGTR